MNVNITLPVSMKIIRAILPAVWTFLISSVIFIAISGSCTNNTSEKIKGIVTKHVALCQTKTLYLRSYFSTDVKIDVGKVNESLKESDVMFYLFNIRDANSLFIHYFVFYVCVFLNL